MDALAFGAILIFAINSGLVIRYFSMSPAERARDPRALSLLPGVLALVMLVLIVWSFL